LRSEPIMPRVLVTGAGGFIGHHLVNYLVKRGHGVRGVDIKAPEFEDIQADEFILADLRNCSNYVDMIKDVSEIYHLAADSRRPGTQ